MTEELVDWYKFELMTQLLYEQISKADYVPEVIVAISRGGLLLGRLLSEHFNKPLAIMSIKSYQGKERTELILGQEIATTENLRDRRILLVDDLVDSGETLYKANEFIQKKFNSRVKTATLYRKPFAKMRPNFFIMQTTNWIIFPYELKEKVNATNAKLETLR